LAGKFSNIYYFAFMEKMIVVGAGLCGTLLAVRLAQRGYQVDLYEKMGDMRKQPVAAGRSINLALSDRGFKALRLAGLEELVKKEITPMYGRMIHADARDPWLSRYSGRQGEHINSVSRQGLNKILLDATENLDNLTVHYNHKCLSVDFQKGAVQFLRSTDNKTITATGDRIFGTDGAGSAVRRSMLAESARIRFNYSQDFLDHGYKELVIPPASDGSWQIEKNALHIWPRQSYMLIALPNLDGSFTVTLFLPFDADPGFNQLTNERELVHFFKENFPDALELRPTVSEDFFTHPTGILGTIRCSPWSAYGKSLLMGDAAHAVVPFYGQGMNCSLEDVVVLDTYLDAHSGDWGKIFEMYEANRKTDTDAIAFMALENYYEMRDHVDNSDFIKKRQLELLLEENYPDYSSKYSLVTFNEDVTYSRAMEIGHKQDDLLLRCCNSIDNINKLDLQSVYEELKNL
jgi:kynurenine 3-monooxygenase